MKTWIIRTTNGNETVRAASFTMNDNFLTFQDDDGTVFAVALCCVITFRREAVTDIRAAA